MIKNKQVRQGRGFTLVELLVSVAILLLVLGSAVSVEVQSIKLANTNEHSLQAANLAQEQLNLVKTVRDNNDPATPFAGFDPIIKLVTPTAPATQYQLAPLTAAEIATDGKKVTIDGRDYYVKINISDVVNLP